MTRTMLIGLALMGLAACDMAKGEEPAARATPSTRSLPIGTTIDVTMDETVTSRNNQAGETVTTTVDSDLLDAAGRIVIPAGSVLTLTIAEVTRTMNQSREDGTLVLQVSSVRVRDRSYPLTGEITSLTPTLRGRGGTVVAVHTARRDVVVSAGTPVGITLTGPLKVAPREHESVQGLQHPGPAIRTP